MAGVTSAPTAGSVDMLQGMAVEPGVKDDERPDPRPGHVLAAVEERPPERADRGLPADAAPDQASLAQPLLAERPQRTAHPGLERQREALLGPADDLGRKYSLERLRQEALRCAVRALDGVWQADDVFGERV